MSMEVIVSNGVVLDCIIVKGVSKIKSTSYSQYMAKKKKISINNK